MTRFIIKRLLGLIPTMFVIITLSFIIIRIAPGGPFSSEKNLPPEVLQNIEKKYHMDEPLYQQYFRYIGDLLQGDLGPSFRYKDHSCNELIAAALPVSMSLGAMAMLASIILGLTAGILSALRQNHWQDYTLMSMAVLGISVPMFVVGPLLMLLFAIQLHWLPTSGWIDSRAGAATLILPVATLALTYFAYIARLSRASILETLRSDYVRTAKAKGLRNSTVLLKHVLKGAMLPVVSFLGPAFADIMTGSVVVESVFLVPGVGRLFVQSALNRDYTLILAGVIVYSLLLVLLNFIVDIVYGLLDPRISYN